LSAGGPRPGQRSARTNPALSHKHFSAFFAGAEKISKKSFSLLAAGPQHSYAQKQFVSENAHETFFSSFRASIRLSDCGCTIFSRTDEDRHD
jgi:hypothetical protein